eukprot:4591040-Pyramimonas_sp.AAC.1
MGGKYHAATRRDLMWSSQCGHETNAGWARLAPPTVLDPFCDGGPGWSLATGGAGSRSTSIPHPAPIEAND